MPQAQQDREELNRPPSAERASPLHGFRGERGGEPSELPAALSITISREAGARGGTIARRAGAKLGWQVYNQELLEYISHEGPFREGVVEHLPAATATWVEERLQLLVREQKISQNQSVIHAARIILALGTQGEAVLLGRGAGYILPPATTLNVRIVAPRYDRIAYMSEWLRLTVEEATEQVRLRDERRTEFIASHFHRKASDVYQYDLLLNSSLLGEELCAEMIAHAARAKQAARFAHPNSP
jgi:cytidylate kinase